MTTSRLDPWDEIVGHLNNEHAIAEFTRLRSKRINKPSLQAAFEMAATLNTKDTP